MIDSESITTADAARGETGGILPRPSAESTLKGDLLINGVGHAMSLVPALVLVPVMLVKLGADRYGLWILGKAATGWTSNILDLGLSWTIIREVSKTRDTPEPASFVSTARLCCLGLAIIGSVALISFGAFLGSFLGRSMEAERLEFLAMLWFAVAFIPARMLSCELRVFQGLGRFDVYNTLLVTLSLVNAIALIVALWSGAGVIGLIEVQSVLTAFAWLFAHTWVIRLKPQFRLRGRVKWSTVFSQLEFSLSSQSITTLNAIIWDAAPFLLSACSGLGAVTQYYIGGKFPLFIMQLVGTSSPVVVSKASEGCEQARRSENVLFVTGTRVLLLAVTPICIVLWILAPYALRLWVGQTTPDAVSVMRILAGATLAEAVCTVPFGILWGKGEVLTLVVAMCLGAVVSLSVALLLTKMIGVAGPAWGCMAGVICVVIHVSLAWARRTSQSVFQLARAVLQGFVTGVT